VPIYIRNSTPNRVFVAVGYYNEGCSFNRGKRGWYLVGPGRTALVFGGKFNHDQFRYYAEDDFGHVWSGGDYTNVPEDAFDMCWIANCTPCRRVGFRVPLTNCAPIFGCQDIIINLVLTSSRRGRRQSKSGKIVMALPTKRILKYRKYRHGIINKMKSQKILKNK
jgi:hypothetical protein